MRKRIISIVSVLMMLMLIITGCVTGSADNIGSNTSEVTESTTENDGTVIDEDGTYDSKDDVALYIETYGHLPSNYITKKEAQALGWEGGFLEPYAPGKCIGGSISATTKDFCRRLMEENIPNVI